VQQIVERLAALPPIVIVGLIFYALVPARSVTASPAAPPKTFIQLKEEFGGYYWVFSLGYVPAWLTLGFLFFILFWVWQGLYGHLLPDGDIKLTSWLLLALPSLFLGLIAACLFMEIALRRFFGGRCDEFKAYTDYRYRIGRFPRKYADYRDGKLPIPVTASSGLGPTAAGAVWVAVGFLLLLIYLGLRAYIVVDDTGITISRYVAPAVERHAFSDIAAIASTNRRAGKNGKFYYWNFYQVAFNDHKSLTTDWLYSGDEAVIRPFVELLSERSGVPIANDPYTAWMSAASFDSSFKAMRARRYFPERIEGRLVQGQREFRGKFMPYHDRRPGDESKGAFRYQSVWGEASNAFAEQDQAMASRGFRRLFLQKFGDDPDTALQATWVKDDW